MLPSIKGGLSGAMNRIETKAKEQIDFIRQSGLKAPLDIIFGMRTLEQLGERALPYAAKGNAFVIMGTRSAKNSGLADRVHTLLNRYTIKMIAYTNVVREPTVRMVDDAVAAARVAKPNIVISLGGGSVIDCGKAVAALLPNEGSVEEYLEGSDNVRRLANPPLPHIAVPTNFGTGSEMTKNAVIALPEKGVKRSMRDDHMFPTVALIDSELSLSVPPYITASCGMDALAQLIEPCISVKRQPAVTQLAHEGLRNVQLGLSVAYEDPNNSLARERLALVSMLGGVCLANAGLAMAHGIAAALGAMHDLPHGLACGILLSHSLRYNQAACEPELKGALAAFLNEMEPTTRTLEDGISAIESLARWLQIPQNLKFLGVTEKDLDTLAEHSLGSSLAGNPTPMTRESVKAFLQTLV